MPYQLTGTNAIVEGFMFGPFAAIVDYAAGVVEIMSPSCFGRMAERTIQRHWRAVCSLLATLGASMDDDAVSAGSNLDIFTATF